jgi:polyphosphate kinase 2 (PPK2 family)
LSQPGEEGVARYDARELIITCRKDGPAMFETAELGVSVDKEAYKREVPRLREGVLAAQKELAASDLAVVVIIGGVEGAGKTEVVNQLLEWVDARGVETHAMGAPTDEERERLPMWRFWRNLPWLGRITIYDCSWYGRVLAERTEGFCSPEDWRNRAKWDACEAAAVEMIEKTSTTGAPWVLVEAEDKNFARIKVMKAVIRHLKQELG